MTKYRLVQGNKRQALKGMRRSKVGSLDITIFEDVMMEPGEIVDVGELSLQSWVDIGMAEEIYETIVCVTDESIIDNTIVAIDNDTYETITAIYEQENGTEPVVETHQEYSKDIHTLDTTKETEDDIEKEQIIKEQIDVIVEETENKINDVLKTSKRGRKSKR